MENMKVTKEQVEKFIIGELYYKLGTKITACVLILEDGFEVVGTAGVVDADSFDMDIGRIYAKEDAMDGVWKHLGSILQHELYLKKL